MNEQPVKKKKRHLGLWITLIVIFVIVILPVGLVFAFFFDPSHTTSEELGVDTSGKAKSFTENLVVDFFDYTDDADMKNSLSLSIHEKDINQTLYDGLLSSMDENTKSFVPQAYLTIDEDQYVFTVELNAYGFFKSKLHLYTTLTQTSSPKGLMFEITNLKLGRLGRLQNIAFSTLKNFVNDNDITIALQGTLTLESHLFDGEGGKHYLFYSHDNFVKDINKMIDIGGSVEFFKDFIIHMFEEEKFTFDFYQDKAIHGLMSLQDFHDNPSYCSYSDYVIDFQAKTELNKYLPTILKNSNASSSNVDTLTKFISYGYNQLTESEKTMIDGASYLPAVLGKSVAEYSAEREAKFATKGKALAEVESLESIVSNQISDALTEARVLEIISSGKSTEKVTDAVVNEIQLHDVLKTNSAIGYGKTFYRLKDDGNYKVAYVSVDNLYVNIINNNIYFVVGININGYEVSMVLSSIIQSGGNGKIYFKLDGENTYFGNYKMGTSLFNSFANLLGQAMSSSSGWFSYDKNSSRFVIDFSAYVNDNPQIKKLKLANLDIDIGISAVGAKISDNGYLNISIEASRSE